MSKTFVSACVPVYNGELYVRETIESLLEQDYGNFEVVVIDNASTDRTSEIIKSFSDRRLRCVRFEKNVPPQENWSRSFDVAKGDYIAICHADDVYEPDFISKEASFLDRARSSAAVFSSVNLISGSGKKIGETRRSAFFNKDEIGGKELLEFSINEGYFPLVCPTFMVRKEAAMRCGRFDGSFKFAFDMDYYFRLFDYGSIGFLEDRLADYRQHPMQGSVRLNDTTDTQKEFFDIIDREIRKSGLSLSEEQTRRLGAYKRWGRIIDAVGHAKFGNSKLAMKISRESFSPGDALIDFPSKKFVLRSVFDSLFIIFQYISLGQSFAEFVYGYRVKKRE